MHEVMVIDKKPLGRPSLYTPEAANRICEELAAGKSLREICEGEGMPSEATVRTWALDDVQGFYSQYARAREIQAERWAEEIITISDAAEKDIKGYDEEGNPIIDHEAVARAKLRVDTRKWVLSKILPKKYGESTTIKGDKDNPLTIQALATALDDRLRQRVTHDDDDKA